MAPGGSQYFQIQDGKQVGQAVMHQAAEVQVTGEAQYCDDVPKPAGTLHAALVLSSVPHARILKVRAPGRIMPASLFTASHHTSATPGIIPSHVSTAGYHPITCQPGPVSSNDTSARLRVIQ